VKDSFRCPHCGKPIATEQIAAHMGKVSAKKMKRGPEFFRQMQAKRKTRAGGRPPAKKST